MLFCRRRRRRGRRRRCLHFSFRFCGEKRPDSMTYDSMAIVECVQCVSVCARCAFFSSSLSLLSALFVCMNFDILVFWIWPALRASVCVCVSVCDAFRVHLISGPTLLLTYHIFAIHHSQTRGAHSHWRNAPQKRSHHMPNANIFEL